MAVKYLYAGSTGARETLRRRAKILNEYRRRKIESDVQKNLRRARRRLPFLPRLDKRLGRDRRRALADNPAS